MTTAFTGLPASLGSVGQIKMIAALSMALGHAALGQTAPEIPPKVSDAPLTAEQLAVSKVVLSIWFQGDRGAINLSTITAGLDDGGTEPAKDCFKGHRFENPSSNLVHRIRTEDLSSLGARHFRLVDPEEHAKEVEANDPQNAIREGRGEDIDKAVDKAIAHGLFTLGEVQFDKSHTYAFVSFSFVCGMLCGNGNTWLLKKGDGNWRRIKTCGGWVS